MFKVPEIVDERSELDQSCLGSGRCPEVSSTRREISCGPKMEKLARFSVSVLKQTAEAWPLRVHTLRCLSSLRPLSPLIQPVTRTFGPTRFMISCALMIFRVFLGEERRRGNFCGYHFWDFGMF